MQSDSQNMQKNQARLSKYAKKLSEYAKSFVLPDLNVVESKNLCNFVTIFKKI